MYPVSAARSIRQANKSPYNGVEEPYATRRNLRFSELISLENACSQLLAAAFDSAPTTAAMAPIASLA
eukprot:9652415-Alexandrium_andersonii.AAC.1